MKLSDQEIARQQQSFEAYKAKRGSIFDSKAIAIANSEHQMRERLHAEANAPAPRDALLASLTSQRSSWLKMGRPVEMIDEQIAKIYADVADEKRVAKMEGSQPYKDAKITVNALRWLIKDNVAANHEVDLALQSYHQHEDSDRYRSDIEHLYKDAVNGETQRRHDAMQVVYKNEMTTSQMHAAELKKQAEFDTHASDAKGLVSE